MRHGRFGVIILKDNYSLADFYRGKRVLLTGHTGFKGTWMSIMLEKLGAEVCGYSLPLSPYSFYCHARAEVTRHCEGDIADKEALERVILEFKPEIVIHLASHSSLDGSNQIPDFILRTNIMGVVNLLDICRKQSTIKSIVIVTSDKCYKNLESDKPYNESCDLGGDDPYSVSKVCQELITSCYQKNFFEDTSNNVLQACIATARASNVIGVGDYNISRLIPYVLESFKNEKTAMIRNPKSIRPWQYVMDVVWGYLLLAKKLYIGKNYNGAYNFGPNKDGFREVGEIVKILAEYFPNSSYTYGTLNRSVKEETKILKLDSTKAQSILNWKPLYTVEEMAEEIATFIMKEKNGAEINTLCKEMVNAYLEKVEHMYE